MGRVPRFDRKFENSARLGGLRFRGVVGSREDGFFLEFGEVGLLGVVLAVEVAGAEEKQDVPLRKECGACGDLERREQRGLEVLEGDGLSSRETGAICISSAVRFQSPMKDFGQFQRIAQVYRRLPSTRSRSSQAQTDTSLARSVKNLT